MEVIKEAGIRGGGIPTEEELEQINRFAKGSLTTEEVYAFSVRLCDNEVDRDYERFRAKTLEELAPLFVGKSGIFDHQWSAQGQTARIYRTEVVREDGNLTRGGEGYCFLKGYAYMLRNEKNRDLIREIEGGIKREVSVGCAVQKKVCSICGKELQTESCPHRPGREYEGRLCVHELAEATDAYEFSFVAVPAQTRAGVMKHRTRGGESMEELEKQAELGRRYLSGLRKEAVRLGAAAEPELAVETLKSIMDKLDEPELLALSACYAKKTEERFPVAGQLPQRGKHSQSGPLDGAFMI